MKKKFKFELDEQYIFLKTKNVSLIILTEKLAKYSEWFSWLNDQKTTKFTKQGLFPNTRLDQIKYFKNNIANSNIIKKSKKTDKRIQLGIVCNNSKKFIGVISLFRLDFHERSCSVSMLVTKKYNNINSLNVIKDAQQLMIDHAFLRLNIRRIYIQTYSKELSELAQKIWGFKLEGVLREKEFLNGKHHDSYALGQLKREWEIFRKRK